MDGLKGLPEELSLLSRTRHQAQRQKRRDYFLMGPIRFGWIIDNIPDPASRLILVVRAFMEMNKTHECVLTTQVWDCSGIEGADRRSRVLQRVRQYVADYDVIDRPGRPSVLRKR